MPGTVSCDHSGSYAVCRAWQRTVASGTELWLTVTAQIVARMLRLVGLDRTVSVYPDHRPVISGATTLAESAARCPEQPCSRRHVDGAGRPAPSDNPIIIVMK
jgi:hypothetical protein